MSTHEGKIGENKVSVVLDDMTKVQADAYVIPEFTGAASFGGVGGAVARAGGTKGLEDFQRFVDSQGEQKFGTVLLTKSGGGNAKNHLHIVSVGSPRENEFNTVQTGFYNALKTAEQNGIKSIVAPAMGTGIIGQLTGDQSARAMMSALDQFTQEGGKVQVSFLIYGDKGTHAAFAEALDSGSYKTVDREEGKKEFNLGEWVVGMQRDADANQATSTKIEEPAPKKKAAADEPQALTVNRHDTLPNYKSSSSYLVVKPADLEKTLEVVDKHIKGLFKRVPLEVYTVDFGDGAKLHAIESGNPDFYMGIGENSVLFNQVPPIKNGIYRADLKAMASNDSYKKFAIEGRDEMGTSGKGAGGTQDVKSPEKDKDKRVG